MMSAFADTLPADAVPPMPILQTIRVSMRSRAALQLEILAMRHQLQVDPLARVRM
jgi:hypothetical protein